MTAPESASSHSGPDMLRCANHPRQETMLRCNRCGKPICAQCAEHTPVGYRCKECIRQQKAVHTSGHERRAPRSGNPLPYLLVMLAGFAVLILLLGTNQQLATTFYDSTFCEGNRGICDGIEDVVYGLGLGPRDPVDRHLRSAVRLVHRGDISGAIDEYAAALEYDMLPERRFYVLVERGDLFRRQGNMVGALDDYAQALALVEEASVPVNDVVSVYDKRVEYYMAEKNWQAAVEDLDQILVLVPAYYEAMGKRGYVHLQLGNLEDAIRDLKASLEGDIEAVATRTKNRSELVDAYVQLGTSLHKLGRDDEAVDRCSEALQLAFLDDRNRATLLAQRGFFYLELRKHDLARSDLDQAIALAPDLENAWGLRAQLNTEMNRFEEAIADATRALDLCEERSGSAAPSKECWHGYFSRAYAFAGKGDHDAAIDDLSVAIALLGDDSIRCPNCFNNRANAYLARNEFDKAVEDYSKAIELALQGNDLSGLAMYYENRASAYRQEGDSEKAEEDERRAAKIRAQLR